MAIKIQKKTRKRTGIYHLKVVGDMTIHTASEDHAFFLDVTGKSKELHVNLSGITDIDTTGVQTLLVLRRWQKKNDTHLHLHSPNERVLGALSIFNVLTRLQLDDLSSTQQ